MAIKKTNITSKLTKAGKTALATQKTQKTQKTTTTTAKTNKTCQQNCEKLFVQFYGKEFNDQQLYKIAKECYEASGQKEAIKDLKLYVKPEESKVYYVVNDNFKGDVVLY